MQEFNFAPIEQLGTCFGVTGQMAAVVCNHKFSRLR